MGVVYELMSHETVLVISAVPARPDSVPGLRKDTVQNYRKWAWLVLKTVAYIWFLVKTFWIALISPQNFRQGLL